MITLTTTVDRAAVAADALAWFIALNQQYQLEDLPAEISTDPTGVRHILYGDASWTITQDGLTEHMFSAPADPRSFRGWLSSEACSQDELA